MERVYDGVNNPDLVALKQGGEARVIVIGHSLNQLFVCVSNDDGCRNSLHDGTELSASVANKYRYELTVS